MSIKVYLKKTSWIISISILMGALFAGTYLVSLAGAEVSPPEDNLIKFAKNKRRKKRHSSSNKTKNKRKSIKKHSTNPPKKRRDALGLSNAPKIKLNPNVGLSMPGTGNGPLKILNKKGRTERDAKNGKDYDAIKSERRLKRDKRRYQRMDDRIERLEKRLNSIESDPAKESQAKRLRRSIERLKKRKVDLEKRLKDAGQI